MSQKVVVIGGICFDFVSYVDRFPKLGESIAGKKFIMGNGGKGASCGLMASLMGSELRNFVVMIGQVGDDMFGESCLNKLKEANVNTDHVLRAKTETTAIAVIYVDSNGENCLVTHLGANMAFMPDQISQFEDQIASAKIVMLQNEIPHESNIEAFRLAKKHGVTTFLNAAPYRSEITLDNELFKMTDILCTNENETESLIGRKLQSIEDYEKAAAEFLEFGIKYAIVTLGSQGALISERTEDGKVQVSKVEALQVNAVDTTGAGDSFCGSFAYFYSRGISVFECAKRAAKVASLSVTRNGNQSSYPSKEELQKLDLL